MWWGWGGGGVRGGRGGVVRGWVAAGGIGLRNMPAKRVVLTVWGGGRWVVWEVVQLPPVATAAAAAGPGAVGARGVAVAVAVAVVVRKQPGADVVRNRNER